MATPKHKFYNNPEFTTAIDNARNIVEETWIKEHHSYGFLAGLAHAKELYNDHHESLPKPAPKVAKPAETEKPGA